MLDKLIKACYNLFAPSILSYYLRAFTEAAPKGGGSIHFLKQNLLYSPVFRSILLA